MEEKEEEEEAQYNDSTTARGMNWTQPTLESLSTMPMPMIGTIARRSSIMSNPGTPREPRTRTSAMLCRNLAFTSREDYVDPVTLSSTEIRPHLG